MSFTKISYEKKENIVYIGFGLNEEKSMTVLTETSLTELDQALDQVAQDKEAKGLILFSHKDECFLAGMDVSVIQSLSSEAQAVEGCEKGQNVFNKIEDLKVPTMALVHGLCLGGGMELALACDKIAASDDGKTSFGLPEVMLGVLPGFGGTYRMPKKIGLPQSLDLILTGKQVRAKKALKLGLIEFMMPKERLMSLASEYLFKNANHKMSISETLTHAAADNFIARKVIFQKAREKVLETTKGFYPAPLKILDHLETSHGKKRDNYLASEARAFGELSQTSQSKNLQHVFFLQDNAKKMDKKDEIRPVKKGGVLGAGTMGGGIAWLFAKNNQAPIMKDVSEQGLKLGLKQSSSVFRKAVKRRRMSEDEFQRAQRSIEPTLNYDGFKSVDLLVEAVVENIDVKKKVFAEAEKQVREDCLLTSNTSSLSVEEMSKALEIPERFAGLHFFNPVNKMPLVEIIRHPKASDETIRRLYKWALDVKKTPVVVNDGPGFLVNRILAPFLNEAAYLLEEGVSIEAIDKASLNFGMPMGACRLMDEVGLDVGAHVGEIMESGLGERHKASALSVKAVEKQLLGKKNKKGFYLYDEDGKQQGVNPEMVELLPKENKSMGETELQMRMFLPMINEAAFILQDKIVDDAATVDLGLIFGIGFPPFRGGLLKYADSEGLDRIVESLEKFAQSVDAHRYGTSQLLKDLVSQNKKFYEI
ncbi:MAG: enoyl-CoA hydratase/isomerase family protein [Bacteriovoracaceae bacterium]|nr:enoyl-CoA hydratase/isomerase family protein [Bacteriovoracaceae bacterium]